MLLIVGNIGGTAVGTGLNTPKGFDEEIAERIAEITGYFLICSLVTRMTF